MSIQTLEAMAKTTAAEEPKRNAMLRRPAIRVTTEFDSDTSAFFHKVSCKVFDSLAKFKLTFHNGRERDMISDPQLSLSSKYLSLTYDIEDRSAFLNSSLHLRPGLYFSASHHLKEQQGELAMVTDLAGSSYKLELSTDIPTFGLPKATFKFPCGEVSLEEKNEEEVNPMLSFNGLVKGQILNGVCSAQYNDENLNLKYLYKDEKMTLIPSISLPLNTASFAFKRRFSPSDKLSYWYNFDSNDWSTVYKHTVGEDYKFKVGYDSNVRLGWTSLWVGDELGKAKSTPMKAKIQFMLQVPQDDIASSALMFRVKKRWDI